MGKRAKFRIGDSVRILNTGRLFLKLEGLSDVPEGDFRVLGREGNPPERPWNYLLENVKQPYHFALWLPEVWLINA